MTLRGNQPGPQGPAPNEKTGAAPKRPFVAPTVTDQGTLAEQTLLIGPSIISPPPPPPPPGPPGP